MGKELFFGTFVHSLSLGELEIANNSVIGVENGKITFIEKNIIDLDAVTKAHNYEDAMVFSA
jgi:hypothetical protein